MDSDWLDFYVATASASAALTGLLFVAVALRPREIRNSPLMVGRARAAFYAFATVLFVGLFALAGTSSRWLGLAEIGVAALIVGLSAPFTLRAFRGANLNYGRAVVYHVGLGVVAAAGIIRAVNGVDQDAELVLALGSVLLLSVALSNSWQLVLSHDDDREHEPDR